MQRASRLHLAINTEVGRFLKIWSARTGLPPSNLHESEQLRLVNDLIEQGVFHILQDTAPEESAAAAQPVPKRTRRGK